MERTRGRDQRLIAGTGSVVMGLCPLIILSGRSIARSYNGFPMLSLHAQPLWFRIFRRSAGPVSPHSSSQTRIQLSLTDPCKGNRSK